MPKWAGYTAIALGAIVLALLKARNFLFSWILLNSVIFVSVAWVLLQYPEERKTHAKLTLLRYTFYEKAAWLEKSQSLSAEKPPSMCLEKAPKVSRVLTQFTNLIISNFIDGWCSSISKDELFQDSIRVELDDVYRNLQARLMNVDIARLVVLDIVPVLTNHYLQFRALSSGYDLSYSIESKLAMAQKHGKLHAGVSLIPGSKESEKAHLRKRMHDILPLLLSKRENLNELVCLLLQELLACTVLANAFDALSEGDFYNQMIVKLIGANLKHRSQVQRLRAALQEHSKAESSLPVQLNLSTVSRWMAYIENASEGDLRKAKKILDSEVLPDEQDALELISTVKLKLDHKMRAFSQTEKLSLEDILSRDEYAAVFREYLKKSSLDCYLDLWWDIELMKAPLEDSGAKNVTLQLEFSTEDDIKKIHSKYFSIPDLHIGPSIIQVVDAYIHDSNVDLYQRAREALFTLQKSLFSRMKTHFFPDFRMSERFGDLESALPKQNRRVASTAFPTLRMRENVQPLDNGSGDDSAISPAVVRAVESAFEKIMENSPSHTDLSQQEIKMIFNRSTPSYDKSSNDSLFGDNSRSLPRNLSSSNRLSALFENNSDMDSDTESVSSDYLNTSGQFSESQMSDLSNLEVLFAGPGDLSLAEQITVLDNDIENLSEQSEILLSLIKKAELTNNLGELKILRRSNASLEREINSKELQKQQYIVQENENSLYGKSRVQIQSCVFGSDENLPYVLYVIEVQKYSSESPDQIVAGWVVARRFSQFYKLNEYLRRKYDAVADLKFPKKSVPYLKFKMTQQTEVRRPALENYLKELLDLPEVCSDSAFRTFLSSETFKFSGSNSKSKRDIDAVLNKFYKAVGPNVRRRTEESRGDKSSRHEKILQNIKDMERELKQFDDIEKAQADGNVPFVKPISDLLLAVFDLGRNSWLRGRALLVILQQVLGSTIERTIQQMVENNVKQELKVAEVLTPLVNMLFPDGKFRSSPEVRTKSEQSVSRQDAYTLLQVFMDETCSRIFGARNTASACTNLFEMLQNDYLNKHLLLEVTDIVLNAVFPELSDV